LREIADGFGRDGWDVDVDRAEAFLTRLFDVGCLVQLHPELHDVWVRFRDDTAPALVRNAGGLAMFADDLQSRLSEPNIEGDEWIDISRRRSALEFLGELYAGTEVASLRERWSPELLVELLRERCKIDGFIASKDIPQGVPRSHWWWWCPNP
jgi:hypothetical protein